MWLQNGDQSILVSPQGGSILEWQWKERTILGPARIVRVGDKLKKRGETHWCFPNFGSMPEGVSSLLYQPKHGFLRNTLLEVDTLMTDEVRFQMPRKNWKMTTEIKAAVSVTGAGFDTWLEVTNHGANRLAILPALHPYFAVPKKGLNLRIGDTQEMRASDVSAEALTINRYAHLPVSVHLYGIGTVHMELSNECSHLVVWSDNPSEYVCVEPIFGKPGTFGIAGGEGLEPNKGIQTRVGFYFEPE